MEVLKQNTITAHIIQFCRFLRENGFVLGPMEEILALEALKTIPYHHPSIFKSALKATLVKNKFQLDQFDPLYLQYWAEVRQAENAKHKKVQKEKDRPKPTANKPSLHVIKKWLYSNHETEKIETASYDVGDGISEQDFTRFSHDNLEEILLQTKVLVKKLTNRTGHRFISSKNHVLLDIRRLMRKNIGRSDELIELSYKKKKIEKLRLVLICDVSRSMEFYTKFLLQFMYGLNQATTKIETFVFSTRIQRITKSLQDRDFSKVLQDLKDGFDGWSAGTKIGESLWDFVKNYSGQLLDQKTKVIILSDGWDTGDADLVAQAMQSIRKRSAKIIWLNPLAGHPTFKPETACLQAAIPYVDVMSAISTIKV
ncbi:vWA domain-containing protein [Portibacter marinus]|uniref:vWA domain-containing protein n=1 Tax=Portibacter marinus TaxID=2898660 RepID=UPI001F1C6748|nr:VWA domain-containing protein [Portibacter marinus]